MSKIKAAILGASGYTGAELIRLLVRHPKVEIIAMTADRKAGLSIGEVFPHLAGLGLSDLTSLDRLNYNGIDIVFCCLPHGTTQEVILKIPEHVKIIDLSADFRLNDVDTYAEWYGHAHQAPKLQKEAIYGLTEVSRDYVKAARLVANPGCYPTSAQLPLIPLLKAGQVSSEDIIIDAKSGVSGAGRGPNEGTLFTEVSEAVHAYGIANHRHAPEIEQGLSNAAGQTVTVNFTPHLMPMNRGILSSIYVKMENDVTASELRETLLNAYGDEPFVRVVPEGVSPATRHVRGSNHCLIGIFNDRLKGRAIILSVIDNLVKGASGQAIQNMNVMFGLEETTGLTQEPMFP